MKLPVSLPDELLLSRLIRYVTVSGDKGDNFASKVFGSRKVSIHPFLTARLEQLAGWGLESAEVIVFSKRWHRCFFFFSRLMLIGLSDQCWQVMAQRHIEQASCLYLVAVIRFA